MLCPGGMHYPQIVGWRALQAPQGPHRPGQNWIGTSKVLRFAHTTPRPWPRVCVERLAPPLAREVATSWRLGGT